MCDGMTLTSANMTFRRATESKSLSEVGVVFPTQSFLYPKTLSAVGVDQLSQNLV